MRRLLTGYAVNFNHRHKRSGHLFQNRYKSILCEEDAYLLELIRYIHLNPLRAKMVPNMEALDLYPWSGHAVLMGSKDLPGQVVDEVLLLFGKQLSVSRRKYRQFVVDGVSKGRRPELVGGGMRRSQKAGGGMDDCIHFDDRVLGSSEFVETLRQEAAIGPVLPPRFTLSELRQFIGELFDVVPESISRRSRGGSHSEARAVFCYAAVRMLGIKGIEVGKYLVMGPPSVSRASRRGEEILQENGAIREKLNSKLYR